VNTVRFHDEARAELVHEVGFYTAVSRRLGERFDNAVKKAIYRAAAFPELESDDVIQALEFAAFSLDDKVLTLEAT